MAYDVSKLVKLGQLQSLATRVKSELTTIQADLDKAIQYVGVNGNLISFYTSTDGTGDAAFTVDFPQELFLDQAATKFVPSFAFTAEAYPGATNPALEGKPVMVLAVKGQKTTGGKADADTTTYSFLDMEKLVDTYAAADGETAITVEGYTLKINVPTEITGKTGVANALKKTANGLEVDISGKANLAVPTAAGNIATLTEAGDLQDSGIAAANILAKENIATDEEATEVLNEVFGAPAAAGE